MSEKGVVTGKAFYRERIALPPGAVFEAVLEDVSMQDAKAREIGRTVQEYAKGPPYVFSIEYDPKEIDPRYSYSVRTIIKVDGKLKFTSDTVNPVLTRGSGSDVEIWMKMIDGRPKQTVPNEAGTIIGGEVSKDSEGKFFTDAVSGKRHELADGGERGKLDIAYDQASLKKGAALYMTLEGTFDEEGKVHVARFINAWPNQDNERSKADSSLVNTYWRIVSMRGERVPTINLKREPHVILKDVDGQGRYSATVGCNQLVGGYAIEGKGLTFMMGASTMMACVPPLDVLERTLTKVLAETKRYSIKGQTMELYDKVGSSIALLEAVYL
jgi:uncharacterized lipoprotein YbaY/heat shock protein HslJ